MERDFLTSFRYASRLFSVYVGGQKDFTGPWQFHNLVNIAIKNHLSVLKFIYTAITRTFVATQMTQVRRSAITYFTPTRKIDRKHYAPRGNHLLLNIF